MHPRNRDRNGYNFNALRRSSPELIPFICPHPLGGDTIDFADPDAVTMLNRALLKEHYGVSHWTIPGGYLCPAVPGRADYIHHIADLLSDGSDAAIPVGEQVVVLDIGTGANCVYPLIGSREYGWRFVGSEIDPIAIQSAKRLLVANAIPPQQVEVRAQASALRVFDGVVRSGERFAVSICNPPFHASGEKAAEGTLRKLKNLGGAVPTKSVLNFGGRSNELWCEGGEPGFVHRMIQESASVPELCGWFTTLVSKSSSLPAIYRALDKVQALEVRTIPMGQGQKQSRIVAWSFLGAADQHDG